MPDLPIKAEQHSKAEPEQLSFELEQLPEDMQDVLRQIAIEQRSYEGVENACGGAAGPLISRIYRAASASSI